MKVWNPNQWTAKKLLNCSSLHLSSSKALLSRIQGYISGNFFLQFGSRFTINCKCFVLPLMGSAQKTRSGFEVLVTPFLSQWENVCSLAHTDNKLSQNRTKTMSPKLYFGIFLKCPHLEYFQWTYFSCCCS